MKGFGRYNLLCKLGEGGMGVLYLARQKTLKRYCGLKLIHAHLSKEKNSAERFLHEARSSASLSHPNLVHIFDCDEFEGQYFIAMEFVEGFTVGEIIRNQGPLPFSLAFAWLYQAAQGLEYLHQKNLVHRDIKPDNMMINAEGTLKIMDFGLAKYHLEGDQTMTMSGMILGSPNYMSPEQINESRDVDCRTDIYSLGIVLYQMLLGKLPFSRTTTAAVMMAQMNDPMPSVCAERPDALPQIDEWIGKLTAKDKNKRTPSAMALMEELKPWMEQFPVDEEASEFWRKLDFKSREVSQILAREKVDSRQVDMHILSREEKQKSSSAMSMGFQIFATTAIVLLWAAFIFTRPRTYSVPLPLPSPSHSAAQPSASVQTAIPKLGGIFIKTIPIGATILFQAREKESPASFGEIPVGKYLIRIYKTGYQEVERQVEVVDGKFVDLNVSLSPLPTAPVQEAPAASPAIASGEETKPFDPMGKSESELIAQWGGVIGRIDFGEEVQLMFQQGRVTLRNGKVTEFFKRATHSQDAHDGSHQAVFASKKDYGKENQELLLKRMQNDLEDKMRELNEMYSRKREELQRFDADSFTRRSYQEREKKAEQVEESLGIPRLKNDIQELQDQIRDQLNKIYEK